MKPIASNVTTAQSAAMPVDLLAQATAVVTNQKLSPDVNGRNDGRWHVVDVPNGQTEVRFARWDKAGRAVYEAKGRVSTMSIHAASFDAAVQRVQQLVQHRALTPQIGALRLPPTSQSSTTLQAPSKETLTIDLEDPSMRDGEVPKPWLSGKRGSYFIAPEAIVAAKDRGVPVRTIDLNSGRGDKDLHAYISLRNDAKGGAKYALITAGSNPPFKIPTAAGAPFRTAYEDMNAQIGRQQVIATVNDAAAAGVALPRGNRSLATLSRPRSGTETVSARTPRSQPGAMPASSSFPRLKYRGATNLGYLQSNIGRMLPGLDVNPKQGSLNCLNAAIALERQRAGKPAVALVEHFSYEHDVYQFYGRLPISGAPDKSGQRMPFDMKSLLKHVESLPKGARGILLVESPGQPYGHAMVIENVNGRAVIMDGQHGFVVNPKALSTGVTMGELMYRGTALADMPDKPFMRFEFLRTDDVRNPGSALPKNVKQARVEVADEYNKRVALNVVDSQGNVTKQWVDQSATPGVLRGLTAGENVYLVDDRSSKVRAPGMLVIKQSDGLKMMKRIESRQ